MEDNRRSMLMSVIKDGENAAVVKPDGERSLLINDLKKGNRQHTSARPLSTSKDSKNEYPNTEDMDRSLYMDNTTSWLTSLIHIIKGNIGIGALSLPLAMSNSGIVGGPILLLVTGVIVIYCMHLMIQCSHALCNRYESLSLGYAQVAEKSITSYYPKAGRLLSIVINVFLVITQLGFCCVYFIFVSQNLHQVFLDYIELDVRLWIVIIALPTILLSFVRTLKVLSFISMVANILYFSGVLCVLIYAGETMNNTQTLPKFVELSSWPLAFGIVMFSLEGIGVVLPVENVMASPRKFHSVLSVGMCTVLFICLILGILGFSSCGMHCLGSITLNLPNTPYYTIVKGAFSVAIFFTYFIMFYVPMTIIIPPIQEKLNERYRTLADYGIRTLSVCVTAVLAISIGDLGDMISLVGSIGCTSLAMIFPPIIHILTFSYDKSLSTIDLVLDILIVVVGVLGSVSGVYSSIMGIIWKFQYPGIPRGVSLPNSTHSSL